ncbi:Peptide methionine sulfoxide reductase [Mycena kentingensis (nom. inval.)]|nr:Peptide methionine sulfoxide reductase [Mycena kentingensis (nom. inval.)]
MEQSILLWSLSELRRWVVLITQGQVKDFGTAPKIFLPTPATSVNPDPATPGVYTKPSVPSMMSALSASRPVVSSPLAGGAHHQPTHAGSQRPYAFPTSRALRPFPSASGTTTKKQPPTKMIQPPSNQQYSFVLDLSQAELRRQ